MKISVIVPVFNTGQTFLKEALDSLRSQSGIDCEFLLIDDGSCKKIARYLDSYALTDSRFRVFHKKNGGLSSARNFGLDRASGDYVWFMDADDVLEPGALQLCACTMNKTAADLYVFRYRLYTGEPLNDVNATGQCTILNGRLRDHFMAGCYFGAYVWTKLIRSEIAHSVRFREDAILHEDLLYMWELLPIAETAVYMDIPLYRYRIHAASAVHSASPFQWFSASAQLAQIVEEAKAEQCLSAPSLLEHMLSDLCKAAAATGNEYDSERKDLLGSVKNAAKALRVKYRDILSLKSRLALCFLIGCPRMLPLVMRVFRSFKKT